MRFTGETIKVYSEKCLPIPPRGQKRVQTQNVLYSTKLHILHLANPAAQCASEQKNTEKIMSVAVIRDLNKKGLQNANLSKDMECHFEINKLGAHWVS